MTLSELIARCDTLVRPLLVRTPPKLAVHFYSRSRLFFLKKFYSDRVSGQFTIPEEFSRTLWGIRFQSPLFNSAGMFKTGEGYELVARQGAGAYLAGTSTAIPRHGNTKDGIYQPFAPYPYSGAASNWLGLPNAGHAELAKRLSRLKKIDGCPIGASLSASPEQTGQEALQALVEGMNLYQAADVDFLELNESCPNVPHGDHENDHSGLDKNLVTRLEYVQKNFLAGRKRRLPLIVKFSNDTDPELLPHLLGLLLDLGFDGVNFGNTSTRYRQYRERIIPAEQPVYDFFTSTFGGGLSGRLLKQSSLDLSAKAVDYIKRKNPAQEFHVIRTGGIERLQDIHDSEKAGIALNQWYTGYFEEFAHHGHKLYRNFFTPA